MSKKYTNVQIKKYERNLKIARYYIDKGWGPIHTFPDESGRLPADASTVIEDYTEEIVEFTVDEWPGKIFGIWSEEACWVREVGKPAEEIQYGYSNHGPYWREDENIFWDVLDPEEDPEFRGSIDDMPAESVDLEAQAAGIGLDLNYWENASDE